MRVNQAQPFEACGCGAEKIQTGNENTSGITDNHHDYGAAAVDQKTDLAVETAGKKRHLARQLIT